MLRRRTAGMLAASTVMVVASMGLSGCGPDNPAPKPFNPPKAASSSGSSSSSVDSVPQMPDEAKQNNAAGAKAFVRYYFEVFSEAAKTGDVKNLQNLNGPKCPNCDETVTAILKIHDAGGWIRGGEFRVEKFQRMPGADYLFTIDVHLNEQTEATTSESKVKTIPAEDTQVGVEVRHLSDGWQMVNWGFLS